MAEKRSHRRYKRRLAVKYGEKDLTSSGFTSDVSIGGLFITTRQVPRLDARLHLQLFLETNSCLYFEGIVRRQKLVPPELSTLERGGFGVRFLTPREALRQSLGAGTRLELHFNDVEQLKAAYEGELRLGGAFVPTAARLARNTQLTLELCLDWSHEVFELESTVVNSQDTPTPGLFVVFDKDRALLPLRSYLQ